ncbi:MAG: homoserine dehydrogenase [Gemmatimonadaceae bacterium]|nr:homoserine dehydrogenase [Gemmatimonadaceae bacterium]
MTATATARRATAAPLAPTVRAPRIALAGCGTVGDAFVRLLHDERVALAEAGLAPRVVRVLVRDVDKARPALDAGVLARTALVVDPDALLGDDVDTLVEATGDVALAHRLVVRALERGLHVITANKALLAREGPALAALAARHGATLDCEAAVGGAVPVVRAVRTAAGGARLHGVRAVLNGTCAFILDRLVDGTDYAAALAEAQRLGLAEADPTRDVEGLDVADKLRVLAWLAFGADPRAVACTIRGIARDADALVAAARAHGAGTRLALVGELAPGPVAPVARVEPVLVPAGSPWAALRGAANRVELHGGATGTLVLEGPGAGGDPTASALLADLVHPVVAHVPTLRLVAQGDVAPRIETWCVRSGPDTWTTVRATRSEIAARLAGAPEGWAVRVLEP